MKGPILGIGMSGQAGSSFIVLGVLIRLTELARQRGEEIQVVYALDLDAGTSISKLLVDTARQHGIQVVHCMEVPIEVHRRAVDSGSLCWYGEASHIHHYVEDELRLFRAHHPALVVGFIRPTLYYSLQRFEEEEDARPLYWGIGCSLVAGPGSYGVPADFFPDWLAPMHPVLYGRFDPIRDFFVSLVYAHKCRAAARYIHTGSKASMTGENPPRVPFRKALFGDRALIASSPLLTPKPPRNSLILGLMDFDLALDDQQQEVQEKVIDQLERWQQDDCQVVLLSMGTTGEAFPQVLQCLLETLREREKLRLVTSRTNLAGEQSELSAAMIEAGYLIEADWLQMSQVLPYISLLATHGGLNTIETALKFKVPILVAAPQQLEQGYNGLALKWAKIGDVVWQYHLSKKLAPRLAKILSRLNDYSKRMERFHAKYGKFYDERDQYSKLERLFSEQGGR